VRTTIAHLAAVGATLALAAGFAACDDDGAAPLTKAEYLQRANEICRSGDREIPARAEEFFAGYSRQHPPTAAKEAQFVRDVVIPTHQRQLDDLRAIPIPEGDEDEVEPFLQAGQDFLHRLADEPSLFIEQRVTPDLERASTTAARYGLEGCAY
jgi:hypothetical protein